MEFRAAAYLTTAMSRRVKVAARGGSSLAEQPPQVIDADQLFVGTLHEGERLAKR
ncbi:hypothetical protein AB0C06_21465 [Micromonospora inaquosa]|uniref:hypothetical protein n=1 Tax=Micromonospora inaquosa TaxID=2203716 RepID=UPI0013154772|nr:hypothetical protein [Micromonospora inaquosa]